MSVIVKKVECRNHFLLAEIRIRRVGTRIKTYALCEIGAIEISVLRKRIEVALNFVPLIHAVGFPTADESEPLKSLLRTRTSPVEPSPLLTQRSSRQGRIQTCSCTGCANSNVAVLAHRRRQDTRRVAVAPREPPQLLLQLVRELLRLRHRLRFQLLREVEELVRRAPSHRRPRRHRRRRPYRRRRPCRRRSVDSARNGVAISAVNVHERGRLDAPEHDGVVVLQIERDLDELLIRRRRPSGTGARRRRSPPAGRPAVALDVGRPAALVVIRKC